MSNPDEAERASLREKLKEQREYLGYSQEEVADAVGMARSAISLIENGQRKIEVLELSRLAKLYQKSVGYFTGDSDIQQRVPENVQVLTRLASNLTKNDLAELQQFAEFLQTRKENKREN